MTQTFFRIIIISFFLSACANNQSLITPQATTTRSTEPRIEVVAEGLLGPIGLATLANGALLVAEAGTGERDNSGGVSLITPHGQAGRLISGFPSSRDAGDLAGVNFVALAPDQDKLYMGNFGQGHLWTLTLTAEQRRNGLQLPDRPLTLDQLTPAMLRLNNVLLTNPFDLAFDDDGVPVVSDASGNGVAKENPDGTTRFIHRFDPLADPTKANENITIDAVPTGIAHVGEAYLVTLTGGCPYPQGAGQLVAIDEQRNQRTIVENLNMPIDVAQGPDGSIWLLEFARFTPGASCFSGEGYQANTGRLSQLQPDGTLQTVLADLNFPGAVLPLSDGTFYISNVFDGTVIHVTLP